MSISFSHAKCQSTIDKKRFGICDYPPPPHRKAYIDFEDGTKWIAVVVNEEKHLVTFTAIDHCIEIRNRNGNMVKRCDGVLTFDSTITFVELKERDEKGNKWVKDAEKQILSTISQFEKTEEAENYTIKKAYISNSQKPKFKESQKRRMDQFFEKTGYILRIENRIIL